LKNELIATSFIKRKAIGTIIGAAFFLLIFTSVFSFLYVFMNTDYKLNEAYAKRRELDLKKSSEKLELVDIQVTAGNKLNLTLVNMGQITSRITYIGEIIETPTLQKPEYNSTDITIGIGETIRNVSGNQIDYTAGETKKAVVVTELGNIFLFQYPPPTTYGTPTGSSVITITGIQTLEYNPTSINLISGITGSGSVSDLEDNDGAYLTFISSQNSSLIKKTYYVDNNDSDIDGSIDKGTHSNFSNQRAGPDSVADTLTEENTGPFNVTHISGESFEGSWPPTGWAETPSDNRWNKENDQALGGSYSADFDGHPVQGWGNIETLSMDCSNADAIYIEFWYRDEGCDNNEFVLEYYDGSSWDTIADLGSTMSEFQWIYYAEKITDPQYLISNFQVSWAALGIGNNEHAYVDLVTVVMEVNRYEIDLEVQWTDIDYTQTNEMLSIYITSDSSEALMVDAWDGDSWENVIPDLSLGWNNVSVSSYLVSPSFTIRFKGSVESTDSSQNSWGVDATLLTLWSDQYIVEVELIGTSNLSEWTDLVWQIDSSWNISSVPVTIQLFDFITSSYPESGDGYYYYVSDSSPGTDEWSNQTITTDAARFHNAAGQWKIKIRGGKSGVNSYQLNIDWVGLVTSFKFPGTPIDDDVWCKYMISARTLGNNPVSYGYISIYYNGTSVSIRSVETQQSLSNPDWVYLNENGEYFLELKSSNPLGETLKLGTTVGDLVGTKIITQNP
jgi:hypothetical protein